MIRLTIRQMEYFAALAQTLHFGRAARLVGVTQPALSAQIAEMEERLDCRLFDRGGRAVRLTEDARLIRPRIARILTDIRELETTVRRGRAAMEGRIRVGVIPTVAPYLLPLVLPGLKARFPALSLELREAVTATLIEETMAGRLDAMVAALPLERTGLEVEPLLDERFVLAVPAGDPSFASPPVAPQAPELERLMLLEEGHCMRDQALALCGAVTPSAMTNYGATSLTTLLQMVVHGQGLTLLPAMAVPSAAGLPGVQIVPFADPQPLRHIACAWRASSSHAEDCRTLAMAIRAIAAGSDQREGQQQPHADEHQVAG